MNYGLSFRVEKKIDIRMLWLSHHPCPPLASALTRLFSPLFPFGCEEARLRLITGCIGIETTIYAKTTKSRQPIGIACRCIVLVNVKEGTIVLRVNIHWQE
jgi:hypothetical protein